jgi:hypothetical protein
MRAPCAHRGNPKSEGGKPKQDANSKIEGSKQGPQPIASACHAQGGLDIQILGFESVSDFGPRISDFAAALPR